MEEKSVAVKRIYSLCFFGLMVVLGIAAVVLLVQNHLSANESQVERTSDNVSFSAQYPFEEKNYSNERIILGSVGKYRKNFYRITDNVNQYLTALNPLSSPFKSIQNGLSDYTYSGLFSNGSEMYVRLPNGYLTECFEYCPSHEFYNNILDFSTWLEEMDIPFVSLITPDKSDDSITVFPKGVKHGYAQMLDEYKEFLDSNGLKYIESKQTLLAENDNFYSWFYKSDHHWNVHAGYTMARETAKYLNDVLSIATDTSAMDEDNFKLSVYPNCFLGSYGKKLGNAWKEDIEVLYPTKETDFRVTIPGSGIDKTGSFENTLIDQNLLKPDTASFRAFLYGDYPLVHIENNNCQNGTRVLVIKFSFANALCPYLACSSQYLDMIDPRNFDGSIRSYIKQTKPDCVILCMGVVTEYDESFLQLR